MNEKKDFTVGMNVGQKVSYYLLYGFVYLSSLIPLRMMYVLSDLLLYPLVYYVVRYRRKLVRKNLHDSFPGKTDVELKSIERGFYHWFCDYIYEAVKLTSMSRAQMRRRVTFNNVEYVNQLIAQKRDVALYLGHYCNWEWVTSIALHLPQEIKGGQVYHPLENKAFDTLLLKNRASMGSESISMLNILRHVIKARRDGMTCVIGFISDQVPLYPATRYWTDFLNHKDTLLITGTEQIARQFDFACVYLDIRRPRRGYYDITVVPICENPKELPEWEITERYTRLMEKTIQHEPRHWLWTHNRWKRTREGLEEYNRMKSKEKKK